MNDYQEDFDYILDSFDFERVKKVMDLLEWKYFDSEGSTVSIYELRKMARYVLKSLLPYNNKDNYTVGCGGFEATVSKYTNLEKPFFQLKFVVEEQNSEH